MDFEKENNKDNEENIQKENDNDNENNEEQEENSINVYDDNAYMLDEEGSEKNSLNNSKNENELDDYQNQDKDQQKTNEIEGLDDFQNEEAENNEHNNYLKYVEQNKNLNQNIKETNNPKNISNNNNNININNLINYNQINNKEETNKIKNEENNNINNNKNNENEEENIREDGEIGEDGEEEGDEEENLPLITLKYVSICQCCKNSFDSEKHLPYLFKCGHFFCKECIEEQFTDEEGIKCPIDGLIAKTIKEFKLLNNLITDKTIPSQRNENENNNLNNNCQIHKGQKLTHIVVNTKEIVCVYCAFDLIRKKPNCEVKELKEIFEDYLNTTEKIININQNNVEIIQKTLKDIKNNKQNEEKNVLFYFEHILKYINTKKEEILSKIDSIFTENATKLSQKLENFSAQIELGESLKEYINNFEKNNNLGYNDIYEAYLKLEKLNENENNNKINLKEYKFIHDDEAKIMKYTNYFGDIKIIYKYIPFKNVSQEYFELNDKNNNNYNQNTYTYNSNEIINNNNNYKTFLLNKKNNLNILDDDINKINNYINTQNINNLSEYSIKINKYNKKSPMNYIDYQNTNNNNSDNKNNTNWDIYNLNKEKIYNNNSNLSNLGNFKFKRNECGIPKRLKSPSFYRYNINNNNSFHRFSSPTTYTYTLQLNNK